MQEEVVVICNPLAKGRKAASLVAPPQHLKGKFTILKASTLQEATLLARQAAEAGAHKIVAAGGDGTLNAVANGIIHFDTVLLGLLPVGTMNVFAREIGLPTNLAKCWEVILNGRTRKVDVGFANGRAFLTNAGVGLDAQVISETDTQLRKQLGALSYVIKGWELAARTPPELEVQSEQLPNISARFVIIGNGRFYGGPFEVFTGGTIDDGFLDVVIFQRMSQWDVLRYLHILLLGHSRYPTDLIRMRTAKLTVRSNMPQPYEVDGEVVGLTPVNFLLKRLALSVLCP